MIVAVAFLILENHTVYCGALLEFMVGLVASISGQSPDKDHLTYFQSMGVYLSRSRPETVGY